MPHNHSGARACVRFPDTQKTPPQGVPGRGVGWEWVESGLGGSQRLEHMNRRAFRQADAVPHFRAVDEGNAPTALNVGCLSLCLGLGRHREATLPRAAFGAANVVNRSEGGHRLGPPWGGVIASLNNANLASHISTVNAQSASRGIISASAPGHPASPACVHQAAAPATRLRRPAPRSRLGVSSSAPGRGGSPAARSGRPWSSAVPQAWRRGWRGSCPHRLDDVRHGFSCGGLGVTVGPHDSFTTKKSAPCQRFRRRRDETGLLRHKAHVSVGGAHRGIAQFANGAGVGPFVGGGRGVRGGAILAGIGGHVICAQRIDEVAPVGGFARQRFDDFVGVHRRVFLSDDANLASAHRAVNANRALCAEFCEGVTLTNEDLARAICCEGQPCMRPEACDANREYRVPVSPTKAAHAVRVLLCHQWRKWPKEKAQ